MRAMTMALLALGAGVWTAPAQAGPRFDGWTVSCVDVAKSDPKPHAKAVATPPDCRAASQDAPAAGAEALSAAVTRGGAKEAQPMLAFSVRRPASPLARARLALAVDGGTPVRLAPGADVTVTPAENDPAVTEVRLSEGAARRLLPFLRRGKVLTVEILGEADGTVGAELALPGLQAAFAEIDRAQGRVDKPEALVALVGGGTPAALSGKVRDVGREAIPQRLRTVMMDRDCPVWDRNEDDPSFLADESFAADLGDGRTLWSIVCSSGGYNVEFALFIEDPSKAADRFETLLFATFLESIGWTGVDTLTNVAYDPDRKQLTAFEKGRAAGDCGVVGTWEWGGAAFRMVEFRAKEECDGVGEPGKFPIVFRGER